MIIDEQVVEVLKKVHVMGVRKAIEGTIYPFSLVMSWAKTSNLDYPRQVMKKRDWDKIKAEVGIEAFKQS